MKIFFLILSLLSGVTAKSQQTILKSSLANHSTFRDESVYYQINNIDNPENLDIDHLIDLFSEYPTIKFEYSQTISKQEKPGIAKQRMAAFKMLLEKSGVPISNITFSNKVYYLDENDPDQRARIQGIVKSLDN